MTTTAPNDRCAPRSRSVPASSGFAAIVEAQGGDPRVVDDYTRLPQPAAREHWTAPRDGVVTDFEAELIGRAAVALGAGRDRADAAVDPAAGIDIVAPIGATVRRGDPVSDAGVWRCRASWPAARALIDRAVTIGETGVAPPCRSWTIRGTGLGLWKTPATLSSKLREFSTGRDPSPGVINGTVATNCRAAAHRPDRLFALNQPQGHPRCARSPGASGCSSCLR